MSHTPGPWKVINTNGCKGIGYKPGRNPNPQTQYRELFTTVGLCATDEAEAEDLANARLCAAAPELLQYLKGMIERFEEKAGERPHKFCGCTYCFAIAAVVKAEKGTPMPKVERPT